MTKSMTTKVGGAYSTVIVEGIGRHLTSKFGKGEY